MKLTTTPNTPPGGADDVALLIVKTQEGQVLLHAEIERQNGRHASHVLEALISQEDSSLIPMGEVIAGPVPYLEMVLTNYRPSLAPVPQTAGVRKAIRALQNA